jgi:two-component system, OmpR family, response regulator
MCRQLEGSLNEGPSGHARTILLVEDDADLASKIKTEIEGNNYRVHVASIVEATDIARMNGAAMLILDRLLSGADSLRSLEYIRNKGVKIPILVISALSSAEEVVRGLEAGADHYLLKPFDMVELLARVDALVRRLGDVRTARLTVGDLEIGLIDRTASRSGIEIVLLPTEFRLLEYFLRHPDRLITREMLLEHVWQYEVGVGSKVIDIQIGNLRRKIDEQGRPSRIANVRGQGFMLCPRMK